MEVGNHLFKFTLSITLSIRRGPQNVESVYSEPKVRKMKRPS